MKKVGNYNGEDDVERWIDRFELAVEIDITEREAQYLSMLLEGPAYDGRTWEFPSVRMLERSKICSGRRLD